MDDTIAAISSPPGPARRGLLRVSGARTAELLEGIVELPDWHAGAARGIYRGRFLDGVGSQPLLFLWMPGPHSYTREDVAELHLPGSPPLLAAALARVLAAGARSAGPGEFTRRAFQNGRIDLTRAEGVLELVRATNEGERRSALGLLDGGLGRRVTEIRMGVDGVRALSEASLDFDEADTGHVPSADLLERMQAADTQLAEALAWEEARQPPTALPRVLLFGAPNAGKSSLFNTVLDGAAGQALVSELAGTTRDYLTATWELGAQRVLLIDTPGLDGGASGPDASAQRLAAAQRVRADLVLWVLDAGAEDPQQLALQAAVLPPAVPCLVLRNQLDRAEANEQAPPAAQALYAAHAQGVLGTSAHDGQGLQRAAQAVADALGQGPQVAASGGSSRELFARHRQALEAARRELTEAREALAAGFELDQVAEILRGASQALDEIEGSTTPEDLLDRIFSSFCIGK